MILNQKLQPILGKWTCEEEKLIIWVHDIKIRNSFTKDNVLHCLGCAKDYEYDTDLVNIQCFEIHLARTIPLAIREKFFKEEFDKMDKMDVIKPVMKPTPAVSLMVIVKQKR